MKKQTGKIKVECLGRAASEVTQSIYQLTAGDKRIILDYGLYQSSDLVESYKVNHSVIKEISPKKIDFILISHANIDHCGALPLWARMHGSDLRRAGKQGPYPSHAVRFREDHAIGCH